jgi:hypothetical protein
MAKWADLLIFLIWLVQIGCNKKQVPEKAATANNVAVSKTNTPEYKKIKPAAPKVIAVNDSVASKSVDGRLYYDLLGKRYWKNYKDGKYYLFNKKMYEDASFKPPNN